MLITIRPCQTKDRDDVIALWRACGLVTPQNDPHADFQHKIRFQPDLFLVGLDRDGRLQASVMAGYEGHRGWINYLAVSPAMRRRGAGSQMLLAAEKRLRSLGCPKINLQVRHHNTDVLTFYRCLGFTEDKVVSLGKRLD